MRFDATLHIAPDHPAFAGHFPGSPVVPGVVVLDAVVYAAIEALRTSAPGERTAPGPVCQIRSVKFLSPVGPGETLRIACAGTASASVRFEVSAGSRKVASGLLEWRDVL